MGKFFRKIRNVYMFYYEGFRDMSWWGKRAWIIIIIKLIIIFAVLRIFFFPDFLRKNFDDDKQRSEYILDQITSLNEMYD
ncbi:MAG: DUF4492 domain-containing protein [Bacteroidales bacterium]|jgi:hypothetical protein|nr:DUF4492 domain-containing protein [Bacteroidales bacterium]